MGDNTTHALLSPSARHRWGACPGSVREESKYPEPPGGHAANDGTRTHALLERCIKYEFIDKEGVCGPAPCFGVTITDEFGTYTVDLERAHRVNVALEYIRNRLKPGGRVISERRVFPDGLVGRADLDGTVDIQLPDKDIYEIADYKDGMSPVSPVDNPQLEQYGIGVLAELPPEDHPKFVRFTIIQPKLALRGMPPIVSHDVPVAELLAKAPIIRAQADATEDPNAPLIPGESQCKYCRAKGACPALAGKVMQEMSIVSQMFQPVANPVTTPIPTEMVFPTIDPTVDVLEPANQAANKDPKVMSGEQLRQLLEAEPLLNQLMEGARAEVQRRLEMGQAVPGFKLVNGRGSRKWALPEDEMVKKLTGMGIPKDAIYKKEMISPAQAEKLVWESKGEPKKLSEIQLKRMQTEYVTTFAGKPTVAPESDPRAAVILDASPMFGAVAPAEPTIDQQIQQMAAETPAPAFLAPPVEAPAPAPLPSFLCVPAWLQ